MTKVQKFKEIASNVGAVLKKYWYFKNNYQIILSKKNISEQQVDKILEDLIVPLNWTEKDEDEQASIEDSKLLYSKILLVDSFYSNHELFKHLMKKVKFTKLENEFRQVVFIKSLNENTKIVNLEDLTKNIAFINDKNINLLVLEKALMNNNEELYHFIMPYFDLKKDKDRILEIMGKVISTHGSKIKNKSLSNDIKKHIDTDSVSIFIDPSFVLDSKKEKNINDFFDINFIKSIARNANNFDFIKFFPLRYNHKQIKKLLTTFKIQEGMSEEIALSKMILSYIENNYATVDITEKFVFLQDKKLLSPTIWSGLLQKDNKNFLEKIFDNHTKIDTLIGRDKIETVMRLYREIVINNFVENERCTKFVEHYTGTVSHDDLFKMIEKRYSGLSFTTDLEQEAINIIKEKYEGLLEVREQVRNEIDSLSQSYLQEEKDWVDVLYRKFPDFMNSKENLFKIVKSTHHDLFVATYLNKYFENNNDIVTKKEVLKHLKVFNSSNIQKTLEWVIDNDLLNDLIPKFGDMPFNIFTNTSHNQWVPLFVEKYNIKPDSIIKNTCSSYLSNDELFKFILHTYTLEPKTEQLLCNSVFAINATELANEMFKKGIVPNDYYEEKFKSSPTEAGNILLKSKLKQKLENKFAQSDMNKPKEKIKKI